MAKPVILTVDESGSLPRAEVCVHTVSGTGLELYALARQSSRDPAL